MRAAAGVGGGKRTGVAAREGEGGAGDSAAGTAALLEELVETITSSAGAVTPLDEPGSTQVGTAALPDELAAAVVSSAGAKTPLEEPGKEAKEGQGVRKQGEGGGRRG